MEQSSFQDEQTVRHQFDSLCKLALKSEVINYEKHMAYRQKYEVMLSELSEKELSRLFIMEEHEMETHRFQVLGYDMGDRISGIKDGSYTRGICCSQSFHLKCSLYTADCD